MKLIDADKLKPKIKYIAKSYGMGIFTKEKLLDAIDKCAIEVEPVRRGKWQEISSVKNIGECNIPISKCSCCGLSCCDILNNNELYNYCPNCGARMDGGEFHDD